jgi:hypothetical protein
MDAVAASDTDNSAAMQSLAEVDRILREIENSLSEDVTAGPTS